MAPSRTRQARVGPRPGEDRRLLASGAGGGTPSLRRAQARRQPFGWRMDRSLARIVLKGSSHGQARGR